MSRCTACKRDTAADDALQCPRCRSGLRESVDTTATVATTATIAPERTEAEIQAEIVAWLKLHGWDVTVTAAHTHAKGVTAGTPDLYCRRPVEGWEGVAGHHYWIEVKRPGGRVSAAQKAWHDAERAMGGNMIVAYGIEDLVQLA